MPQFSTDLFVGRKLEQKHSAFWDNEAWLFSNGSSGTQSLLTSLSFKVSRKPKDLIAHLCRIYFCYQNELSEPLYAALLDFLIVLNGKGRKISWRLIHGSRSQLDLTQMSALKRALKSPAQVHGNRFSLFVKGVIGLPDLVEVVQKSDEPHDYLKLANDFIEFSQLDEAMTTLEQGLGAQPDRQDWQLALLELYKSTDSRERFENMYGKIELISNRLIEDWQKLADFFDGKAK